MVSLFGQFSLDFGKRATLEVTKGPLAQAGVRGHGQAHGLGHGLSRHVGAREIAGVDRLQPVAPGQGLGQPAGLLQAGFVQGDVQLALDAGVHIPGGFAVANGEDAGDFHVRADRFSAGFQC